MFDNIFIGNKAAAEDTEFLARSGIKFYDKVDADGKSLRKGITHVLNLASDTTLKFFVTPDKESLEKNGIELKEMKLRQERMNVI